MIQYYTYTLTNSIDNQIFYVGKGSGTRMYQHVREAKNDSRIKRSLHYKILAVLEAGGEIVYDRVDHPNEQAAFAEEIRLIALHGRKDLGTGLLCNLTEGGEGSRMLNPDSVTARAEKHRGMKRSDEARQRMREAQLVIAQGMLEKHGQKRSPESIAKQSAKTRGTKWSEVARNVVREKPTAKAVIVHQQDTGEFVGEWESITLCAKELNCDTTRIWKLCNNTPQMKSHKGYTFAYK